MAGLVRRLWRGEVPLPRAFWAYGIFGGCLINYFATIAALILASNAVAAADGAGGQPWLAVLVHFLPLPVNILLLVAVWRSAARHPGQPLWAQAARIAMSGWFILLCLV